MLRNTFSGKLRILKIKIYPFLPNYGAPQGSHYNSVWQRFDTLSEGFWFLSDMSMKDIKKLCRVLKYIFVFPSSMPWRATWRFFDDKENQFLCYSTSYSTKLTWKKNFFYSCCYIKRAWFFPSIIVHLNTSIISERERAQQGSALNALHFTRNIWSCMNRHLYNNNSLLFLCSTLIYKSFLIQNLGNLFCFLSHHR